MSDVREIMARAIYLSLYEQQGGKWECVEPSHQRNVWGARADAAISALKAQGYEIVPREPTEAMMRTADLDPVYEENQYRYVVETYRAMIAAATSPDASRKQEEAQRLSTNGDPTAMAASRP